MKKVVVAGRTLRVSNAAAGHLAHQRAPLDATHAWVANIDSVKDQILAAGSQGMFLVRDSGLEDLPWGQVAAVEASQAGEMEVRLVKTKDGGSFRAIMYSQQEADEFDSLVPDDVWSTGEAGPPPADATPLIALAFGAEPLPPKVRMRSGKVRQAALQSLLQDGEVRQLLVIDVAKAKRSIVVLGPGGEAEHGSGLIAVGDVAQWTLLLNSLGSGSPTVLTWWEGQDGEVVRLVSTASVVAMSASRLPALGVGLGFVVPVEL